MNEYISYYKNPKRPSVCATEVRALYGRRSRGWLRVALRWEVGVAG